MSRILLVDDSIEATMIRLALEGRGYEVCWGQNGEEGLMWLNRGPLPDIIISKLEMPDMDGLMLLDYVRSNSDWSFIPFVMLSAVNTEDHKWAIFEHGADAFLHKPFRFQELNKILMNLGVAPVRA